MILWSQATGHFYHADLHGDGVPSDAIRIGPKRHAQLLAGQAAGRSIVSGANGAPTLTPAIRVTADTLRAHACADIRREARRRILAVASLERQSNDNALLAISLRAGFRADPEAISAAVNRRYAIDAIRGASNALEAKISNWAAAALSKFDAADPAYWPSEE